MRGHALRAAKKTCLIVAALGLAVPAAAATAQAAPRQAAPAQARALTVHTRTALLALNGPLTTSGSETIDVTGSIAVTVVTRTNSDGSGTARITSTLLKTTGVGRTTGGTYRFVGTDSSSVTYPPDPIHQLVLFPRFLKLSPPDPVVPPNPIVPPNPVQPVRVGVTVTGAGDITGIDASVSNPPAP